MQRSLNGANNFGSILGTSLSKYANLADLPNTTLARQNLGLVGSVNVNSANSYLTITNAFDGTANQTISANATTNATPSTLVAYDTNGAIIANSVGVYDNAGNVITAINCHTLNAGSLKFLNVFALKSPIFANLNLNNIYNFQQMNIGAGDTNYYGVLNVDFITSSAYSSIRIPVFVSMENVSMGANGPVTLSVDNITPIWNGYLSLNSSININGSITLNNAGSSIIDSNNQSAITFDGSANTTIQNSLTITNGNIAFGTASSSIKDSNGANAITFDGSQNLTIVKNMTVNGTLNSSTFKSQGNVALTNVTPFTSGANIVFKTGIKFFSASTSIVDANNQNAITFDGSANTTIQKSLTITNGNISFGAASSSIKDSNGANAMTFDGSGNVTFNTNITVPNFATLGGILFPSLSTVLNFYLNSSTPTGARTDTSGNIFGKNLYRTIWNQPVNSSFSTTTSLGSSFSFALGAYATPFIMNTTVSYRLLVPFTYYGETTLTFNAYLQMVNPTGKTPTIQLEIYSSTNPSTNIYYWVLRNPNNNVNGYLNISHSMPSSGLTIGNCYFLALSDYTLFNSTAFGYTGGEICLGNN